MHQNPEPKAVPLVSKPKVISPQENLQVLLNIQGPNRDGWQRSDHFPSLKTCVLGFHLPFVPKAVCLCVC